MRIIRRFPDRVYRFVSRYDQYVEWVPEPVVQPEGFMAEEIDFEDMLEMAGGPDVQVHQQPDQHHAPPPQHPPRVYRAVRLPASTQQMIRETHSRSIYSMEVMQWMLDHMVHDYHISGRQFLRPPPAPWQPSPHPDGGAGAGDADHLDG